MVQRVGVDVDATPDAGVVGSNRYDPKAWFDSFEVLLPKIVRRRLAYNPCLPILFTICSLLINHVRAVRDIQTSKDRFETRNIHELLYV